jgi:OPA family glycerol-3-phosphate transporter-like MFS transporter
LQSICLGFLTEKSWSYWPPFLVPFSVIGLLLALRIRKAIPPRAGH